MKNKHEIEIELTGAEWTNILDSVFTKKQKEVKIDGFRKGAVPKDVYIKKVGIESLYPDAVDMAISEAYKKVLNEKKLIPVCEPQVDIKDINETTVKFSFVIITQPEVKLGAYKNLKIKKDTPIVTDQEIDEAILAERNKYAEIAIKKDKTIANGDTAVINFEGFVDDKPLDGGSGENYPLEIGSHTFIPGFEEAVIGMKSGEKKEINLKFPENYTEELKNKDVLFKVTVIEVKSRIMPELGKEYYQDLGLDIKTEKEYREHTKEILENKKALELEDQYIEKCLEKAASNMKVDINEEIISDEIHRMIHQYEEQLKMQGLTMDQYLEFTKSTHEDLHKLMEPEATKRVKYRLLIEAVADAEKINVSDEEVNVEAEKMATTYGMEKEEFIKAFGGLEILKYDVKMRKAIELIKNS